MQAEVTGVMGTLPSRWAPGQPQLAGASLDTASLEAKGRPAPFCTFPRAAPPRGPGPWAPGGEDREKDVWQALPLPERKEDDRGARGQDEQE